jgi:chemotaxis methyl-accepting protein methylase/chemotaxis response regulator CheB/signal transduction histidine kinase
MKSSVLNKIARVPLKIKAASFPVVAIGASAGGLEAIRTLLRNLAPDTGMAFIYVQHLSPDHKSFLTSILSKITKMKVQEIENMEEIAPNNVYVIPHNKDIKVTDGHIQLVPRPKNSSVNLSIDLLFSSLAKTHKKNVIGIILSGNARDGTEGLRAIKEEGGVTFAQDESAQASSMPRSAIAAGVVDFVLPLKEIAAKLFELSKSGLLKGKNKRQLKEDTIENSNPDLKVIFDLLHTKTGVDFSHYKMPTIKRRLSHKMLQFGVRTLKEYANLLKLKPKEIDSLYKDLLIHVTKFFRDKEAFHYLKTAFLPRLMKAGKPGEAIRIWIPACSTGQEAYSIAMLIHELQMDMHLKMPVQIFATDLSELSIQAARLGDYSASEIKSVPRKYQERYFSKTGGHYRISKEMREMCVFAPHNILRDPPFSRMDFISCRNLLIYFDATAQKKVFSTLHFALKEGGHLLLGKAETIGIASLLFARTNNKIKIYSKKKTTGVRKIPELSPRFPQKVSYNNRLNNMLKNRKVNPSGMEIAIDSALLTRYMPACAVVNKDMEILEFRGSTELFLKHVSGKASLNILKMTRPEFSFELRDAIHKALKTNQAIRKTDIEIKIESVLRRMSVEVSPLKIDWDEPLLLIVFKVDDAVEQFTDDVKGGKSSSIRKDRKIKKLTEELNNKCAEMNSIIETQETTYEELQSANEEIVSTNEEFQTLNEELETSKEEIEATNEELISTNQELQVRNDLLTESYEYSEAIIATIHEPMLVLNKNFHIKSANKAFYEKFMVTKEDTEGRFLFELGNRQWNIPRLRELLNDILSENSHFMNFEVTHTFPGIGEKMMLLNAHKIIQKAHCEQLILLAIEDITERSAFYIKEKALLKLESQIAEAAVKSKQQFLSNMSHEIRTPMNSIIGFTNVVLKTELSKKQQEYIGAIKTSGDALLILINDILDLAKVDEGKMTFEQTPFNLCASVSGMLYLFDTKLKDNNLQLVKQFSPAIPDVLIGDPIRLRQIMLNLVSNAVKFTSKGKITVNIRIIKEDAKKVTIEFRVGDTGIGIPENQLEQIFDNFGQASNETSRLYGGTGLGLAIVKQLVELQGGVISVKSVEGKGSVFSFILNFLKSKAKITEEPLELPPLKIVHKSARVLVVEDSAMNQFLMKTILKNFGFEWDIAGNGKIAIEKLEKNKYDIVLMDLHMPEMGGVEATAYIRNKMNLQVPIIALTADVTSADFVKCKAAGMNDYLSKPVQEKLLYDIILKYVQKTEQQESYF